MQQTEEKNTKPPLAPAEPISEPLKPLAVDAGQPAEDDDSPDAIFVRAVSEIPTQPLHRHFTPQWELDRKLERECATALLLFLVLLAATVILNVMNQPVVTITLLPVRKAVTITTAIHIPTRTLAPRTLTKTLTATTTGKGHQDARAATGTLTFYNAAFTTQTIEAGTVLTGSDGVQVVTAETIVIPPDNPPTNGQAAVSAHAVSPGDQGNIPALDINGTVSNSLYIKNLTAFTGGRGARDYQAVAQRDLDSLTARLQEQLTQAIPQAFTIAPGEAVTPTTCAFTASANHDSGDEAQTVTVHASKTCAAIAYNQNELTRTATSVFNATRPGKHYERVGRVRITILSITPLTVRVSGSWEYAISSDDEQYLAQQIQGDTPAEARTYLLKTGLVSRVTMTPTQNLPDYYHIKFLILIGV